MWKCDKCGIKFKSVIFPIRCYCGNVDKGSEKQEISTKKVKWITTEELVKNTYILMSELSPEITKVVGLPRSGMIPASIISTTLQLPLYTVENFELKEIGTGFRSRNFYCSKKDGVWLIVDDVVYTGNTFKSVLDKSMKNKKYLTAAIFSLENKYKVNYFTEIIESELFILEWNLFNCSSCSQIATDMDGIICHNPPNDTKPLYPIRLNPIKAIVTARSESRRNETVTWLKLWNMCYSELIMYPYPESTSTLNSIVSWKVEEIKKLNVKFYIESEPLIADKIRELGIKVLCPKQGFLL